jgi:hypothetical protein
MDASKETYDTPRHDIQPVRKRIPVMKIPEPLVQMVGRTARGAV